VLFLCTRMGIQGIFEFPRGITDCYKLDPKLSYLIEASLCM